MLSFHIYTTLKKKGEMSAFTNQYTLNEEEEQKLLEEFRERDEAIMADDDEEEDDRGSYERGGFRSYPNRKHKARFTFSRDSVETLIQIIYRSCLFCSFTGDERVVPELHGYNPPPDVYKGD